MPRRAKMDDDKYIEDMQRILMQIAKDPKTLHKEKIDAAKEAAKLLFIKKKIKDGTDGSNFFDK